MVGVAEPNKMLSKAQLSVLLSIRILHVVIDKDPNNVTIVSTRCPYHCGSTLYMYIRDLKNS